MQEDNKVIFFILSFFIDYQGISKYILSVITFCVLNEIGDV